MNEGQYRQVCEECDRLLMASDSSLERVAIPWLHVLNEHPSNLLQYEHLFDRDNKKLHLFFSAIKKLLFAAKALLNSVISQQQTNLPPKVDVLIFSHLLNPSQMGATDDFYFGRLPEALVEKGYNTLVVLRDHTASKRRFAERLWPPQMAPRLLLPQSVSVFDELRLRKSLRKEAKILLQGALLSPSDFEVRVRNSSAQQAVGPSAMATMRLYYQVKDMVRALRPKSIVVTYEGHTWERIVFAAARSINPQIRCIGYQHAILFPRQHAIGLSLGYPYNPDIICTAGHTTRKILERTYEVSGIPLVTVGTHRQETLDTSFFRKVSILPDSACLVIPDGTLHECLLLFDFVLSVAPLCSSITFILRLHPVMPFSVIMGKDKRLRSLPVNVKISQGTIDKDFEMCRWALYRGSGAAIRAVTAGLRPFYFKPPGEMLSIDPLYMMTTWKRVVESTDDLKLAMDLDLQSDVENIEKEWMYAVDFTRQYYTPQDLEIFYRSVVGDQGLIQ